MLETSYDMRNCMDAMHNHQALWCLMEDIRQAVPLDGRLHPGLYRIADHDRVNNTEYLYTLQMYLNNNCNAQKCSKLLYLHRNSLVYRIRRIQDIGGFDLSDHEECLYLQLSFFLIKAELLNPVYEV